jgi:hypothetical protein
MVLSGTCAVLLLVLGSIVMTRCMAPIAQTPGFLTLPLGVVAAMLASPVLAQTAASQKVTGPQAQYWVTAETGTGFAAAAMQGGGGFGAIMGALTGRGGPTKTLRLELGGQRDGNPSEAVHAVPGGLGLGTSLTLLGPERSAPAPERRERDVPEMQPTEKPKGRMLFFWGCGDSVGPGQPVVLDFGKMADGVLPPDMRSITINTGREGPSLGRDRGYAHWPNAKHTATVPGQASLQGDHQVQGNFVPEIRFAVGQAHDYMEPVSLNRAPLPSGAQRLSWNRPSSALGFFANGMGLGPGAGNAIDMIFWNSSSARLLGGEQLNGFLPPAETERLIRANVVMTADTTECAVPKEVMAAAGGELMMVNLNAFGPELNVVHPPRPTDPRVTWEQQYQVKLRLRSFAGSMGGLGAALGRQQRDDTQTTADKPREDKPVVNPADAVRGLLKGILNR